MNKLFDPQKSYGSVIYAKLHTLNEQGYKIESMKIAKQLKNYLPSDSNLFILDVGCGYGYLLHSLFQMGYINLFGLDISEDMVAITKEHVRCTCLHGGPASAPPDWIEKFDLIYCNHVLEHVPGNIIHNFLESILCLLKPGGRLTLSVPNAFSPWSGYLLWNDPTHLRLYTVDTLEIALNQAGFKDVIVKPDGPVPYNLLTYIRFLLWKIREAWLKFQCLIDLGPNRCKKRRIIVSSSIIATAQK